MCGRYLITTAPEAMRRLFRYREQPNFPARYNVAPTQPIPIVRLHEGERQFVLVRWGLLPAWVKDPRAFSLLINARGDSVNDKPAFRNAMKRRRCLIPADGFYEWQKVPGRKNKQPMYIHRADGEPIAFAGLWELWRPPEHKDDDEMIVRSCTIITGEPNEKLRPIHDRMPVMLPPSAWAEWLDPTNDDIETLGKLLVPAPARLLEVHPVSTAVNNVRSTGAELVDPVDPDQLDGQATLV
jgi:putative SOS response-associated peptidase YedK